MSVPLMRHTLVCPWPSPGWLSGAQATELPDRAISRLFVCFPWRCPVALPPNRRRRHASSLATPFHNPSDKPCLTVALCRTLVC